MKPKDMANDLINRMHLFTTGDIGNGDLEGENAKQCAIICVNELIRSSKDTVDILLISQSKRIAESSIGYWQEVKDEIYNL